MSHLRFSSVQHLKKIFLQFARNWINSRKTAICQSQILVISLYLIQIWIYSCVPCESLSNEFVKEGKNKERWRIILLILRKYSTLNFGNVQFLTRVWFFLSILDFYQGFFGFLIKPELYQNVLILNLLTFLHGFFVVAGRGTDVEDH